MSYTPIFSNVNSAGVMGNGNRNYSGGTAQVNIAGQTLNIPNAYAQVIQNIIGSNGGRYSLDDAGKDFFGTGAIDQFTKSNSGSTPFVSYSAAQQRIDNLVQKYPQLQGQGDLNPYQNAMNRQEANQQQQNMLNNQAKTQVLTETRSNTGAVTNKGTYGEYQDNMKKLQDEAEQFKYDPNLHNAQAARIGAETGNNLVNQVASLKLAPTLSNREIKETSIFN